MPFDLLIVLALLPPVIGQVRGARPSAIAASAILGLLGAAAALAFAIWVFPVRFIVRLAGYMAYHDTYYVVVHVHSPVGVGVIATVFWVGLKLKERIAGRRYERAIRPLLWGILLSVFGMVGAPAVFTRLYTPRGYVDYEGAFATLDTIMSTLALIGLSCLVALLAIVGAALISSWRRA